MQLRLETFAALLIQIAQTILTQLSITLGVMRIRNLKNSRFDTSAFAQVDTLSIYTELIDVDNLIVLISRVDTLILHGYNVKMSK